VISYLPSASVLDSILEERTIGGLHQTLVERVKALPNLRMDTPILDIGCGTGAWLDRLARSGFKALYGLDCDTSRFGSLRAVCSEVDLNTANDLGLDDRKFGLITAIEVVEHLENPGRLFYHVARHLSATGVFLMTTPNIHSLVCRLRFLLTGKLKLFDEKGDPTHIYPILLTSLRKILPNYGLAITGKWPYPKDGRSIMSRPVLKAVASTLQLLLPNDDPGDILCLMMRRM
jgi:2-polyprenyl-3-methyl-5-hydroxy-6-metoxy-1,4-benzoquinol methylase